MQELLNKFDFHDKKRDIKLLLAILIFITFKRAIKQTTERYMQI